MGESLTIGVVRRGYSASGGAEAYLQRFAEGARAEGHVVPLYTTREWPAGAWSAGPITYLEGSSPVAFADALKEQPTGEACDVLFSLERVWRCDVYRAGDGVHLAWLKRRAQGSVFRRLKALATPKHRQILRLEDALLRRGQAGRVIVNSTMVRDEIARFYGYPARQMHVIHNGVPLAAFSAPENRREPMRRELGLSPETIAVVFAGTGARRKGLACAIEAVEKSSNDRFRLLVAGRNSVKSEGRVLNLGPRGDLPDLLSAADIFLLPTLYDPFSNACLEALAAGLPVITTRANGFSEIIREGVHGTIIPDARDCGAIQSALTYWSNTGRREQARPVIRALAAEHDVSRNVTETLAVLTQALRASSTVG